MITSATFSITMEKLELAGEADLDALKTAVLLAIKPIYQTLRYESDVQIEITDTTETP